MILRTTTGLGLFLSLGLAWGIGLPTQLEVELPQVSFDSVQLRLEVDAVDQRAEIALELETGFGLISLEVIDPLGRSAIRLHSNDLQSMGFADIKLETQGDDIAEVRAAYPEGLYLVRARTVTGPLLSQWTELSHRVPSRFELTGPAPGTAVPIERATIAWTPSFGAVGYSLELENEALDFSLELNLPGSAREFTVPAALLTAGQVYDISLNAQGDNDNETEVSGQLFVAE